MFELPLDVPHRYSFDFGLRHSCCCALSSPVDLERMPCFNSALIRVGEASPEFTKPSARR